MERPFALFAGLVGPDHGKIYVFSNEQVLLGGVFGGLSANAPVHASREHVLALVLAQADPFEPNREAPHFIAGEEVWPDGEVEIAVSFARLWRAYINPLEASEVLAPLKLRAMNPVEENRAWGNITWQALATASWDVAELLQLLLAQRSSALEGLASAEQVAAVVEHRARLREAGACPGCLHGVAGEPRPLLSTSTANSLAAGHALAVAMTTLASGLPLAELPFQEPVTAPLGLHRQMWLHRLATRFRSG